MLPQAHHARRNPDQSCRCSKNMASAEKVDARGLILVSKFLLRLLDKLDDEMVQLVTQDQQQRN